MSRFAIRETDFELDGHPFRILSGALHYFRVHPGQWRQRIRAARLMGLNTIETYVAWNEHAPHRGEFDVHGRLDLGAFLDSVAAEGMRAIVRPGPYICAEFDNGGLPAWLTRSPGIGLRRSDPLFLEAVEEYFDQLAPILRPRLIDAGGPIILLQVENEYGAYGSDTTYLEAIVAAYQRLGLTVPYTTIDQPTDEMLQAGSLPGVLKTASFGSNSMERLATLRRHQPTGPLMCAEFWDGWFDSWGSHHHTTSAAASAAELDAVLATGASVNIYMFHGGTNFALTNGANHKGRYVPIATTYDYDAPLDEAGRPTEKYWAFRDVLSAYTTLPGEVLTAKRPAAEPDAILTHAAPLAEALGSLGDETSFSQVPTFDEIGHERGLAVYATDLMLPDGGILQVEEVRDRAWVRVDGITVGVLSREANERAIALPPVHNTLELVVEDQGRVNYGPHLGESKGVIGPVRIDGVPVTGWRIRPLDLSRIPELTLPDRNGFRGPGIFRAPFDLDAASDLFLDTAQWGKGIAWINGEMMGRYWRRGPQRTLYIPEPATRAGHNDLVLLELEVLNDPMVRFVAHADLGQTEE